MVSKRTQLTLFVGEDKSGVLEMIRQEFNPEQYALIKSHVTLCREDELEQIKKILLNLKKLNLDPITIDFGEVIRFSEDKGVLLPAIGLNAPFQQVREKILHGIIEKPRLQAPHITLMHPRNSTCTNEIFAQIKNCVFPGKIEFRKISLIEQETGMRWNVLEEFDLKNEKV